MPLVRVASGLLARHEAGSSTHPFRAEDWDVPSGVTVSVDAQGRLVLSSSHATAWRHIHHRHVPSRTRVFTQSLAARISGMWGGDAAHADAGGTNHVRIQWSYGRPQGEMTSLAHYAGNTETPITQGVIVPARASGVDYRFGLWVDGAEVVGYDYGNGFMLSGTSIAHTSGGVGCALGGGGVGRRYSAYYVMADRYLRVTGLPAGYSVRIGGLVEAAAGGEAVFDLLAVAFPLASDTIEVLDGSGNVVAALTPDGGIWGGDEYEFSGEPEPENPWEPCPPPPATEWESCDGAGVPESDIRERQEEFDTPTHEVQGASILRRPDAISLDYLTAHTLGPIAVADPSRGLVARVWKAWTPDGYEVRLAGANGAGNAWIDERVLFTIDDGGPPILELDIAFEQNGQPVVCLERATGVGGASEVWIWFYDPTVPGMVLRNFGAGRTPRALLDRPLDVADSDVCVFYVADHQGRVAYRQQRDRYAVEILTPIEATEDTFLEDAAKRQDHRVVLILSERDQISGTYSLRTATTTLFPLAAGTEAVEPIHGITAATLEQVFRWLDTQMHPEAIGPVHSLVSARLQELIILYALAGEAIEPAHSLTGITLRDLIRLYAATTEAVAPAHMIAHATLVVAITIDRVLDTEAVEPAHTITSIELQAA